MNRTLLLDADIVAYKASCVHQKDYDFGDTGSARVLDHDKCISMIEGLIEEYCVATKAQRVVVCLSDPDNNFRKELDATYKAKRVTVELPEMLMWAKEYLAQEYPSFIRPRLEADDCMGILATNSKLLGSSYEGDQIIMCSEDKDMRTIPGFLYNPNQPQLGVISISEEDANRFHMWQTLTGDQTDGYPGCPGIGPKSDYVRYLMEDAEPEEFWDVVVEAYASKGFTEEDALLQARQAHILWHSSYNFKNKKIRLWQPYWM
jgi:DNA polymerase-1